MHSCSRNHVPSLTLLFIPLLINLTPSSQHPPESPPTTLTTDISMPRLRPPICGAPSPLSGGLEIPDAQVQVPSPPASTPTPKPGAHKRRNAEPHLWRMNVTSLSGLGGGNSPRGLEVEASYHVPCAVLPPASVSCLPSGSYQDACEHWNTHNSQDSSHTCGCQQLPHPFPWFVLSPVLRVAGNA